MPHSVRRLTGHAANALLIILVAGSSIFAQSATVDYSPGDRVEVQRGSESLRGVVVGVDLDAKEVRVLLDRGKATGPAKQIRLRKFKFAKVRKLRRKSVVPSRIAAATVPPNAPPEEIAIADKAESARFPASTNEKLRLWTDSSGKHQIQAAYRSVQDGKVVLLEKQKGTLIRLPLTKLSADDQRYVALQVASEDENPFETFAEPASAIGGLPSASDNSIQEANWQNVKTVAPRTFDQWKWQPKNNFDEPTPANKSFSKTTLRNLPASDKFFEDILGLYVSTDAQSALVVREQGKVGSNNAVYAELVNLRNSRSETIVQLDEEIEVLDALPDRGLVMYRPEAHGFGNESTLIIDRIVSDRLVPMIRWKPYAHEDWEPRQDIEKAWFLDSDRVMTLNSSGKALTIWDIATTTAKISIPIDSGNFSKYGLSKNRDLLAIVMDEGIAIIDLVAGKHVATLPTAGEKYDGVEFRGGNHQLVGLSKGRLTIWDLATGEIRREFKHWAIRSRAKVQWTGDFVLVDDKLLFDVDRRILLWEYHEAIGLKEKAMFASGALHYILPIKRERPTVLCSTRLPHRDAIDTADRLGSPEELLVVRPGDSIAVEVDIDPDTGDADEIRQSITENLEAVGLKVVAESSLILKAVCKRQKRQTVRINTDNRWPVRKKDIVERNITPHASFVTITLNGDEIWSLGAVARPGHLFWIQKGESLDQALKRLTKPNLQLLKEATFSSHIAQPGTAGSQGAYGASNLTRSGIPTGQQVKSF